MTNRRRFLKLLGVGTAAGPIAAKSAMENEAALLTGLKSAHSPLATGIGISTPGAPVSIEDSSKHYVQMSEYLKVFGKLPEHIERDVRERSKGVHFLDPDIACKRSWSLNVKIATQRERNYERELERYRQMGWYATAQTTFEKITGFRWQW